MPYDNKTQDKVLIGQVKLTHWKKDTNKGPRKQKEVEDKSPEAPVNHKKKKRSPKTGKENRQSESQHKTLSASTKAKMMDLGKTTKEQREM